MLNHLKVRARGTTLALALLFGSTAASVAQVSVNIGIGMPGVSIGINVPAYPQLVQVPNFPVYYAPGLQSNFFFYDGLYWVYQGDVWYTSGWYNGPWSQVAYGGIPLYLLRVPVRYYRSPPGHFRGWQGSAPPRWGEHWGPDWQREHRGWDRPDRRAMPAPAPLPSYQRQYSGGRYPTPTQQQAVRNQNYRYQPRDAVVQQQVRQGRQDGSERQERPQQGSQRPPDMPQPPRDANPPRPDSPPRNDADTRGPAPPSRDRGPAQEQRQRPPEQRQPQEQAAPQRPPEQRQAPEQRQRPAGDERQAPPGRGAGQDNNRDRGPGGDRGRERGGEGGR